MIQSISSNGLSHLHSSSHSHAGSTSQASTSSSYVHPTAPHPKYRLAVETLKKEMEKIMKPKIDLYLSQHHHPTGGPPPPLPAQSSWGINFIKPFSIILQTYSEFPVTDFQFYRECGGFQRLSIHQLSVQWMQQQKQVLIRKSQENFLEKQKNSFVSPGKASSPNQGPTLLQLAAIADGGEDGKEKEKKEKGGGYITPQKEKKPFMTINTALAEEEHRQRHPNTASSATTPPKPSSLPSSPLLNVIKADFTHSVASPVYRSGKSFSRSRSNDSSVATPALSSGLSLFPNSIHAASIVTDSPDNIIHQAKEALWPVFATYCSCGDHVSSPGKLSGANLFTLLSKLGILQDPTLLTDVAVILYQIAQRSHHLHTSLTTIKSLSKQVTSGNLGIWETPSLTFEEFMIFLNEFSKLLYEDLEEEYDQSVFSSHTPAHHHGLTSPSHHPLTTPPRTGSARSLTQSHVTPPTSATSNISSSELWISRCLRRLRTSQPFQRLLLESIFPIIAKKALLAFPEDARLRDRFSVIFSFPVLLALEAVEGNLQEFFQRSMKSHFVHSMMVQQQSKDKEKEKDKDREKEKERERATKSRASEELSFIMKALKQIHLIPNVMNEAQVLQLVKDVLPEVNTTAYHLSSSSNNNPNAATSSPSPAPSPAAPNSASYSPPNVGNGNGGVGGGRGKVDGFLFSQWEYLLCVIACQAVDSAVRQSSTVTDQKKIPYLVAEVLSSIATAITTKAL